MISKQTLYVHALALERNMITDLNPTRDGATHPYLSCQSIKAFEI